jgi:hypothetical protein
LNYTGHAAGLNEADLLRIHRMIPFDYAFRYELTGDRDNVINQTVTVSIEAAFVAVSIGYGVIPRVNQINFGSFVHKPNTSLRGLDFSDVVEGLNKALEETPRTIGPRIATVLKNGFRLNPQFADRALLKDGSTGLDEGILQQLFQGVAAPADEIQFLYAIFDEGSGREFQSGPILNTAGLGISNGNRPFRYFAKAIRFEPQSTIRMQVTEVSEFKGDLHVSLQGYKVLGQAGTPTGRVGRRR